MVEIIKKRRAKKEEVSSKKAEKDFSANGNR